MSTDDTQITELAGRHHLISKLLLDGVEVALPIRDRGVDLIAYLEREEGQPFFACPIQLKANEQARFSLYEKYERIANLLLVYAWNVHTSDPELYALTYQEAYVLLRRQGHVDTHSWRELKTYTLTVGETWRALLRPFRMDRGAWRGKLLGMSSKDPTVRNAYTSATAQPPLGLQPPSHTT